MPVLAADTELDPAWIQRIARIDAAKRHREVQRSIVAPNWIQRDTSELLLAENSTVSSAFTLAWSQTDQYMDPWRDVSLSLGAGTRNRSQYAEGNPVAFTDPSGHCVPRPIQGPNPITGPLACPEGVQNVTGSELEEQGAGCYRNCGGGDGDSPGFRYQSQLPEPPTVVSIGPAKDSRFTGFIGATSWLASAIPGGYSPSEGRAAAMEQWRNCDWSSPNAGGRMNCINANDQYLDLVPVGGAGIGITRRLTTKVATRGIARTASIEFVVDAKQARHVPGAMAGRSELTHPDPQALINRYAHTGTALNPNRERIIADDVIGVFVDQDTGARLPTSVATIHYSYRGTAHIVPARPIG